jgi:hypothetical protein
VTAHDQDFQEMLDKVNREMRKTCGMTPEMIQQATQPGTAIMFTEDRMGNVLSAVKVVNLLPE